MGTQRRNFSSVSWSVSAPSSSEPLPFSSPPSVLPLSLSGDLSSGSSPAAHMREISQDLREEQRIITVPTLSEGERHPATSISMLPDNVILTIFYFYRKDQDYAGSPRYRFNQWGLLKWHILVHVCHRWRQIVFASPRHLNLQIPCTFVTPVKKSLGIWPTFPIIIVYDIQSKYAPTGEDNILAALNHTDRVCEVRFSLSGSRLGKIASAMQKPFPVLRRLCISSLPETETPPVLLPTGFLGGSVPCLQEISISGISFPALPTLLLSTRDLVKFEFVNIPSEGVIDTEVVAASLAALPRLETFVIGWESAASYRDRVHPPPPKRTVLPALTSFTSWGPSEYLEDLVGCIDCPCLNHFSISYHNEAYGRFDLQLSKFLDRSIGPTLTKCRHAEVSHCRPGSLSFKFCLCLHTNDPDKDWKKHLAAAVVSYEGINWDFISLAIPICQFFIQFPATRDNVVHLELKRASKRDYKGSLEIGWMHLLCEFSAVQTLLVHCELSQHIVLALEDIADRLATKVLPSLRLICLEAELVPSLDKFIAARRQPLTIVNTIKEFKEIRELYFDQ